MLTNLIEDNGSNVIVIKTAQGTQHTDRRNHTWTLKIILLVLVLSVGSITSITPTLSWHGGKTEGNETQRGWLLGASSTTEKPHVRPRHPRGKNNYLYNYYTTTEQQINHSTYVDNSTSKVNKLGSGSPLIH